MIFVIGQIIGFAAMGTSFLSTIQQKRKNVILFRLVTDILWVTSNFLIASYPAAINSCIGIAREAVFLNKGKKWATHKTWIFLFAFVYFGVAIFRYTDIYSILPAIASTLVTVAFWCTSIKAIKLFLIAQATVMLVYNAHYFAIAGCIDAVITIIFATISILTLKKGRDNNVKQ